MRVLPICFIYRGKNVTDQLQFYKSEFVNCIGHWILKDICDVICSSCLEKKCDCHENFEHCCCDNIVNN